MLKVKCEAGRKRSQEFSVKLTGFGQDPDTARRSDRKQQILRRNAIMNRDEHMEYEEEKKKHVDEEDY